MRITQDSCICWSFIIFLYVFLISLFSIISYNDYFGYTDVNPIKCDIIDTDINYTPNEDYILEINYYNCNVSNAGNGTTYINFKKEQDAEEEILKYDGTLQAYVYTPGYDVYVISNLITYQWSVIFGIIISSIYFISLAIHIKYFYKKHSI